MSFRGWLRDLVFKRQCRLPWRVRKWLANHFPMTFLLLTTGKTNINTADYWDARYKDPTTASRLVFKCPNKFGRIVDSVEHGARVLDVGCGIGILLDLLRERKNCECTGVDISPYAIEVLRAKGHRGAASKLPVIPYGDSSFDCVIATELIEHLSQPRKTIAEMVRVSFPGGKIIISTPNNALPPIDEEEHLHSFNAASLTLLLEPYLTDIQIETIREPGLESEFLLAIGKARKT